MQSRKLYFSLLFGCECVYLSVSEQNSRCTNYGAIIARWFLAARQLNSTQSSLRRLVLEAATRDRHLSLSAAARVAVCMVRPLDFSSLFIVRRQVSFGLPLFLCPCGVQVSATFGMALAGILQMWPSHLQRRTLMVSEIVVIPVLSSRSSFLITFGQKMPRILRRHLV